MNMKMKVIYDPDTGDVALYLKRGKTQFVVDLEPFEAARLANRLLRVVPKAQESRCRSLSSPELDEWPQEGDLIGEAERKAVCKAAQMIALTGRRPCCAEIVSRREWEEKRKLCRSIHELTGGGC